jgi:tRNA uridine 5-carboxymethylaminomethyl modification enzyme
MSEHDYDVIVVGAGHAGIEASYSAVRGGAKTALVTLDRSKIGEMSCNPAIGGLAKGQIVCEIDALGGLMGQAIDADGIQFRMLNRSKGPAVWGPRAQADKEKYARFTRTFLEVIPSLDLIEGEVSEILSEEQSVCGVKLCDGRILNSRAVIITTGTFLNGLIHIGDKTFPAGRINEKASTYLTDSLRRLGLTIGRLKTGTCPRIHKDSIDWDRCIEIVGDDSPIPFSMLTEKIHQPQIPCGMTHTNHATHAIIRDNLHRTPLYSGQISSTGPRYCPSIEVKIVRFAEKEKHQIYLEPESLETDWVYCNGLATSIPEDMQDAMIHSIVGLERAKILQYGYAIEYDYVCPDQLGLDLQCRKISGLFLAGQINGTSGYEEAGGQGLLAGINAVHYLKGKDPIIIRRDQGYLGVMVDDLVTKGIDEPYRMFTSRAEFRLLLRADTAHRRLCPIAHDCGILDEARWSLHRKWLDQSERLSAILNQERIHGETLCEWLRRPENSWDNLTKILPEGYFDSFDKRVCRTVEADIKYQGYLKREVRSAEKMHQLDAVKLPKDIDYFAISGIKRETKEKLNAFRPSNLGQASRITGITPADIMVLMIRLKKYCNRSAPQ